MGIFSCLPVEVRVLEHCVTLVNGKFNVLWFLAYDYRECMFLVGRIDSIHDTKFTYIKASEVFTKIKGYYNERVCN